MLAARIYLSRDLPNALNLDRQRPRHIHIHPSMLLPLNYPHLQKFSYLLLDVPNLSLPVHIDPREARVQTTNDELCESLIDLDVRQNIPTHPFRLPVYRTFRHDFVDFGISHVLVVG